jgi:hypothetical protein
MVFIYVVQIAGITTMLEKTCAAAASVRQVEPVTLDGLAQARVTNEGTADTRSHIQQTMQNDLSILMNEPQFPAEFLFERGYIKSRM